ncbi:MAG: UDP-glucose/GDP-mannose dehydrogenase family protein [Chloroflexi bacterium]|nr:MAG: UDP-glucose/GDP-mannose dehydrogenase family protein [Chloroflexota bacterium]
MKIGIVGLGAVGSALRDLFPAAAVYDEPLGIGRREDVRGVAVAFVCVPTPLGVGGAADVSAVESVVRWLDAGVIVVRSTVSVGTTRRLAETYHKAIVFQPEFGPGESVEHPYSDLRQIRWLILGGERAACLLAARAWQLVYSSDVTIAYTTWELAEFTKYVENAYLAVKVTFCNEVYEIARAVGLAYEEVRELWLLDPRVGRSHTFVYPDDRGFGGRCLPKDLQAFVALSKAAGFDPSLLTTTLSANERYRKLSSTEK